MTTPTVQELKELIENMYLGWVAYDKLERTQECLKFAITSAQSAERLQNMIDDASDELPVNPYPESIFTPVTDEQYKKINELLIKEMGFPIDRLSGDIGRHNYRWMTEAIKLSFAKLTEENTRLKEELEICRDANTQKKKEAQRLRVVLEGIKSLLLENRFRSGIEEAILQRVHAALKGEGKC